MDFYAKIKLRMMKLLDTKQLVAQGCSQNLVLICEKNIFTSIGYNNIAIFDYPSCTTRFAFTSNR